MLRTLNWMGILFGAGAGILGGLALFVIAAAIGGPTALLAAVQVASFVIAGFVAGRLSLTNRIPAGSLAALVLYFALATVSVSSGAEVPGVAIMLFGLIAVGAGSIGGWLAERSRREKS